MSQFLTVPCSFNRTSIYLYFMIIHYVYQDNETGN